MAVEPEKPEGVESRNIDPNMLKKILQCANLNSDSLSKAFQDFRVDQSAVKSLDEFFFENMKLALGTILVDQNDNQKFDFDSSNIQFKSLAQSTSEASEKGFTITMPRSYFAEMDSQLAILEKNQNLSQEKTAKKTRAAEPPSIYSVLSSLAKKIDKKESTVYSGLQETKRQITNMYSNINKHLNKSKDEPKNTVDEPSVRKKPKNLK